MHVVFFASGGPGNINAAFDAQDRNPEALRIGLLVADRYDIPAIDVAANRGCPCVILDFNNLKRSRFGNRSLSPSDAEYSILSSDFHDAILKKITDFEVSQRWPFDLAVLAYRRIIHGKLLARFEDSMINQHPADLTVLSNENRRAYTGVSGLNNSIANERSTRTSTILVTAGIDSGEILCQGPALPVTSRSIEDPVWHEDRQKTASDKPSLNFALMEIARGTFAISSSKRHPDGRRILLHNGAELPYGGVSLQNLEAQCPA